MIFQRLMKKFLMFSIFSIALSPFFCNLANGGIFGDLIKGTQKGTKTSDAKIKAYANFCVAINMMLKEDWVGAIKYLNRTMELDPASEKIYLYLATCHFQLNQKWVAISYMEKAAKIKPDDFNVHYTLGTIFEADGKFDRAISEYELAIGCNLNNNNKIFIADALLKTADLYIKRGDKEKAISCLNEVINLNIINEPIQIYYKMAELYYEDEDIKNACNIFEKIKEINPSFYHLHFYLAICYERLGRLEEAAFEAKTFLNMSPNDWTMHLALYRIYNKIGNNDMAKEHYDQACLILEKSINLGSREEREYIALGRILLNQGEKKRALSVLGKGLLFVNDKLTKRDIHFAMASIYYDLGVYDKVEDELKKTLEIDDNLHEANNLLGYIYAERGINLDEAIILIQKALKVEPKNGAYLDSLGWAYYKKATLEDNDNMMRLALDKLIEAARISNDPEIREHIGELYYSMGRWEAAEKEWIEALELSKGLHSEAIISKRLKERVERLNDLKFFEGLDKKALSNGGH